MQQYPEYHSVRVNIYKDDALRNAINHNFNLNDIDDDSSRTIDELRHTDK